MDVLCSSCSHEHHIPDDAAEDKRIYFYCTSCGNKIVVDGRKNVTPPSSTPSQIIEQKPLISVSSIVDSIPSFFNITSIVISMLFFTMSSLLCAIPVVIACKKPVFIAEHMVIYIVICSFIFLLILFGFLCIQYLLSKIHLFKIYNPGKHQIDWDFILFDFNDDVIGFLFISFLLPLATLVTILPAIFAGSFSINYLSLIYPVTSVLIGIIALYITAGGYFPAIVAWFSLDPLQSHKQVWKTIFREVVNLPVHYICINTVFSFIGSIITCFITAVIVSTGCIFLATQLPGFVNSFFTKGNGSLSISSIFGGLVHSSSGGIGFGVYFLLIFLYLLLVFLFSVLLTLHQSLITKSVQIINENPKNSVSRPVALLVMMIPFAVMIVSALFFFL